MDKPKVRKPNQVMPEHLRDNGDPEKIALWKKYCQIQNDMHYHPERFYPVKSPDGEEGVIWLDLIQAKKYNKKKIRHLEGNERKRAQKIVEEKSAFFQSMKGKMGYLARQFNQHTVYKKSGMKDVAAYVPYVIELFGQFRTNEEVIKLIFEKYGYKLSAQRVSHVKLANKDEITRRQNEWAAKYVDMDVSQKRGRIERLAYLLMTNTEEYKKDNRFQIERSREIRAIIEQIRKEVEGDKLVVDVHGQIDVTATMNVNLSLQDLSKKISVNSFVVALVAAKRGVDPTYIMNQLTTSYYRNYSGFKRLNPGGYEPAPPSSLINTYDWDAIDKMHEGKNNDIPEAEVVEDNYEQKSLKERLQAMMAERKDNVQNGNK